MDEELLSEFLVESNENMASIEQQLMDLEASPGDASLLDSIFRTVHTVKGSCGFIGLKNLESVAHAGENVLGKMRAKKYAATPEIVSMLLECADAIQVILDGLQASNQEPEVDNSALIRRLHAAERLVDLGGDVAVSEPTEEPSELPETVSEVAVEEQQQDVTWLSDFADIREILLDAGLTTAEKVLQAGFNGIKGIGIAPAVALKLLATAKTSRTIAKTDSDEKVDAGISKVQEKPDIQVVEKTVAAPAQASEDNSSPENKVATAPAVRAPETIRVEVPVLDSLMNQVGELVLTRNRLVQLVSGLGGMALQGSGASAATLETLKGLIPVSRDLNHITEGLQDQLLKTRMQPISTIWGTVPRIVRDMGRQLNKKIRVVTEGQETELDRTILAALKDPLTHIIRNSCDHGIEMPSERLANDKPDCGTLTLKAAQEAGSIVILISDDGAGIDASRVKAKAVDMGVISEDAASSISDAAALQLIFHAGLSTAEKVSNISGRGVGMDVVRNAIEKAGGSVEIHSEPGQGTTLRIRIPLTMAIISGMLVKCAGQLFALPQMSVQELLSADSASPHWCKVAGQPFFRLRGQLLPVVGLRACLGLADDAVGDTHGSIVVVHAGNRRLGLFVDEILGAEELVVKPLGMHFRDAVAFAGCSILGDGSVVPILECNGLIQNLAIPAEAEMASDTAANEAMQAQQSEDRQHTLIFLAASQRYAIPMLLIERLEKIPAARIEKSAEREVLQYRGEVLPVLRWNHILGKAQDAVDEVCCLILSDNGKRMCLQVDAVEDILETALNIEMKSNQALFIGTAVLNDKATEVVDVFELLKLADPDWFDSRNNLATEGRRSILFAEDAPFFRTMLIPVLESMNYEVWYAPDGEAARDILKQQTPDVVLTDLEMPRMDGFALAAWIKGEERLAAVPVIAISSSPPAPDDTQRRQHFHAVLSKMDRQGLAACLAELHPGHNEQACEELAARADFERPALVGGRPL